jgi:uncharacterized membrane-anchored protein
VEARLVSRGKLGGDEEAVHSSNCGFCKAARAGDLAAIIILVIAVAGGAWLYAKYKSSSWHPKSEMRNTNVSVQFASLLLLLLLLLLYDKVLVHDLRHPHSLDLALVNLGVLVLQML